MSSSEPASEIVEEVLQPDAPERRGFLRLKAILAMPLVLGVAALAYGLTIDDVLAEQLTAGAASVAGDGGSASVGGVSFSIFGPSIRITELDAWQELEDGSRREVLHIREATLELEFWPLLERRLVVSEISAKQVRYRQPLSRKSTKTKSTVPTDTSSRGLNDYLKEAQEVLESDEVQELKELLEKLRRAF